MGEIRPPPTRPRRNLRPDIGQSGLRIWYEDPRADSILPAVSDELQITQALEPFQRRIRVQSSLVIASTGDRPQFFITVPADEAWRILYIDFFNADSALHQVTLESSRASPPTPRTQTLVRLLVNAFTQKIVYPVIEPLPTFASDALWSLGNQLDLFGGDQLRLFAEATASVPNVVYRTYIRYELIPPPQSLALGAMWTASVF
jgi:hypothetical protein